MSRAVRCLKCDIVLAPFCDADLAELTLEHLRTVHGHNVDRRHPSLGNLPGGAA